MYSVVLMAALTTGSSAPDCDWFHGGHGHHGGYGPVSSTCLGCYGGMYYGSWAGACGGCYGAYGGSYGWGGALNYNCFGCHGCYGCAGSFGCASFNPYGPPTNAPEQIPPPKVEEKKGGTSGRAVAPDRAKVIVQLPAGARLYVDDQAIKTTSDNQTFSTPRLERGLTYFYEVRAEVVRDGKPVVESRRVLIKAGQEVTVSFPNLDKEVAGVAVADTKAGR
jgi:uncharacterized protein (TIGR03000 family)